jgi:hypothetical protein
VKYLRQAGAQPTFMRLADLGIKGNSHVMPVFYSSSGLT